MTPVLEVVLPTRTQPWDCGYSLEAAGGEWMNGKEDTYLLQDDRKYEAMVYERCFRAVLNRTVYVRHDFGTVRES